MMTFELIYYSVTAPSTERTYRDALERIEEFEDISIVDDALELKLNRDYLIYRYKSDDKIEYPIWKAIFSYQLTRHGDKK